jgi:Ca2+:H+ antiporter
MNAPTTTEGASRVLAAAREEAERLGHAQIGTEHLLLGLLRERATLPAAESALLPQDIESAVRRLQSAGKRGAPPEGGPVYSSRARRILDEAALGASRQGAEAVAATHLFAALRSETKGVAAAVLREAAGVTAAPEPGPPDAGRPERPSVREQPKATKPPKPPREQRERTPRPEPRPDLRAEPGRSHREPDPEPARPAEPPAPRRIAPVVGEPFRLSWRHILLPAVPAAFWLASQHASPLIVFALSCLGVLPLAAYMGEATEHLAERTGPTVGGFLNATFGNAAELIIAVTALRAGLVDLVKASIVGSILGNLLLILGLSLIAGTLKRSIVAFNRTAAGMAAAMLALAVAALVFPALFHSTHPDAGLLTELHLSEAVAGILAVVYVLSLVFSMRTHRRLFGGEPHPTMAPVWSVPRAVLVLAAATAGVAAMSELLVHAIGPVTAGTGVSQAFLGLILIPIIGNAAEHATAIVVARKGQLDLALQIALGSSTQVALLVTPVLVGVGVLLAQPMNLVFTPFQVVALALSTGVTAILTLDGESHWFEGVQLLALYALVAVAALFI